MPRKQIAISLEIALVLPVLLALTANFLWQNGKAFVTKEAECQPRPDGKPSHTCCSNSGKRVLNIFFKANPKHELASPEPVDPSVVQTTKA